MTSTSSDHLSVVLRGLPEDSVARAAAARELRSGQWTRLAGSAALGDAATESVLGTLAERSKEAGRAQGYAAGWAEGRRRAQEEAEQLVAAQAAELETRLAESAATQARLVDALEQALARCGADLAQHHAELGEQAVDLAIQVAEAVLQRELASLDDPAADAVRRALTSVPPTLAATVRLNPDDLARMDPAAVEGRPVTLVADPTVAGGDARVETETRVVDASVAAAMARVREVLGRG